MWESAPLLNAQGVRDHFVIGSGPYRLSSRREVEQYPDESQVQTRKHFFQRLFVAVRGNRTTRPSSRVPHDPTGRWPQGIGMVGGVRCRSRRTSLGRSLNQVMNRASCLTASS